MKTPFAITIAALILGPAVGAQTDPPRTAAFKRLDRNGDGKLTRDEAPSAEAFAAADADKDDSVTLEESRRYLATRQRPQPAPAAAKSATATPPPVNGRPVLKQLPDSDAVRDAAGTGQLFECVHVPGFTDVHKGMNGFAITDLNHDGLPDIVATLTPPIAVAGVELATGNVERVPLRQAVDRLLVLINEGGFHFRPHKLEIRGSALTLEQFGQRTQIPNLADFNGDGHLDILITRSAAMLAGKMRAGVADGGNTLLVSDGAWDKFRDLSDKLGIANETAYNRQSSLGDVNRDGWLDIAIGCDNIGNAQGGVPWSRLFVFQPDVARTQVGQASSLPINHESNASRMLTPLPGRFEDIGGTDLVPDFGGFYHDSAKDKAGPGITLRDMDGDGDLDLLQSFHADVREPLLLFSPGEYRQGLFCWKNLAAEFCNQPHGASRGSRPPDQPTTGASALRLMNAQVRFQKATGNGFAAEARLRYNREKQLYEPASDAKAPGLPYIAVADVDNDGLPDIFATGPSDVSWSPRVEYVGGRFWRNRSGFQFEERTEAAGLAAINNTYRQWYAFFDCPLSSFHQNWKPRVPKLSSQPGLAPSNPIDNRLYYADAIFGDFNNDGWQDLVVLDRRESPGLVVRSILFLNKGDGTFEPQPTTFSGLDSSGISGEAADLNADGLLDLAVAADPDNTGGATDIARYESKVYWNTGAHGAKQNHWLRLTFTGLKDAELIGARVELTAGGRKQYRWIHSNHSYKSGGALDAHFGLGSATKADVKVTLLNGSVRTFTAIAAGQTHSLSVVTQ
ncbi:MAG: CRTAC1 family protein [Pirellulaceae bacterium]|nr:CRTAC1 family protein [Pirellulaceae bacterium]